MKLVVIIPAHNEEKSLESVVKTIPKSIKYIDKVSTLILDDLSTDKTATVAKDLGCRVSSSRQQLGLAKTFQRGLNEALNMGADLIINLDADNQYDSTEIPKLIHTLLDKNADMVVGNRQVRTLNHMPTVKKYGNVLGSLFLRMVTGLKITDASSGFRAFTRETALRLQVLSSHTYTHETIIQAAALGLKVENVDIKFRRRENGTSRLIGNVFSHIWKSMGTILRALVLYKPFPKFFVVGLAAFLLGLYFEIRYLFFFLAGEGSGHVQSVILGSTFLLFGVLLIMLGFIADLIVANRRIQSEILYRIKKDEYEND